MSTKSSNTKKFALWALIAGVGGYLAGILTAPQSGKETREDIKDGVVKGVTEAEKELKKLYEELNKLIEKVKTMGGKLGDSAGKEASDMVNKAKDAKEKVRQMLSAVHEGDAEDKDLQQAIKEATQAIDHLKTYLKK
jgi:gas vesicle protein